MKLQKSKSEIRQSGTLRSLDDLVTTGLLSVDQSEKLQALTDRYTIGITPSMAALIDKDDPQDPIALQFIPDHLEYHRLDVELYDPTGDYPNAPMKALVHRHPDRVLLKPTAACAVYCRFCFRREMVGPHGDAITQKDIDEAGCL
jgi:lysine 2,3-aminomutase